MVLSEKVKKLFAPYGTLCRNVWCALFALYGPDVNARVEESSPEASKRAVLQWGKSSSFSESKESKDSEEQAVSPLLTDPVVSDFASFFDC